MSGALQASCTRQVMQCCNSSPSCRPRRQAACPAAPLAASAATSPCQRNRCMARQPALPALAQLSCRSARRGCLVHATSSSGSSQGPARLGDEVLYSDEVPLSRLQAQLEAAVEAEDYETAAALRDVLQRRRFDARLAVEEANERFYAAFQSGSLAAMSEVWGKGEQVQCIHPLGRCIAGRQAVMDSWKAILGAGRLRITLEDVRVYAADGHAFVTCVEITESGEGRGRIAATNVFEKQGGVWKLVHHHGSPAPVSMRR